MKYSCIDCGTIHCEHQDGRYPDFCLTESLDPEIRKEVLLRYSEPDNKKVMTNAAHVELDGYGKWPRVQETVEFAKRMGYRKIGIATCVGLIEESRKLARILRSHGFEVLGVACKVGAVPKQEMGLDEACNEVGCISCNPILQAELLNREKTELNIVMGLCVGHDSLFYKYSQAVTTTLVTKDRVTGHNPVAALYTSNSYYSRLYGDKNDEV